MCKLLNFNDDDVEWDHFNDLDNDCDGIDDYNDI